MDILEKNKTLNIKGIVVFSLKYLDKGFIYKIITDSIGYIDVFSRNLKNELTLFSVYSFNIKTAKDMYYYIESDVLEFNYYRNSNIIISLNFISEILYKTMMPNIDTNEIYIKLKFLIKNINSTNYLSILLYFVVFYLKFNGYYFICENLQEDKNYILNLKNLEIRSQNSKILNNYDYFIIGKELLLISNIFEKDEIDFRIFNDVNTKRLLGIFTNSLCINLEIKELNSFKFLI